MEGKILRFKFIRLKAIKLKEQEKTIEYETKYELGLLMVKHWQLFYVQLCYNTYRIRK